jgi:hypothetical protein
VNYDAGETVGWPTYVQQIAGVFHQLPAADQATAAIVTSNYGEAGAIDRYGPMFGLPRAFSGHNGYWYWAHPPRPRTPSSPWAFHAPSWNSRSATSDSARGWTTTFASPTTNKAPPYGSAPNPATTGRRCGPRFRSFG